MGKPLVSFDTVANIISATNEPRLPTAGRSVDHIGFEVKDIESF